MVYLSVTLPYIPTTNEGSVDIKLAKLSTSKIYCRTTKYLIADRSQQLRCPQQYTNGSHMVN